MPMKPREHFLWHEMHDVPASTGIYAWYMSPRIPKADLKSACATDVAVRQVAEKLRFPETQISLDGHLSLALTGRLAHEHVGKLKDFPGTLGQVIESGVGREFLGSILHQVTPMFCAPLYIGVSCNLSRRIQQHRQLIESFSARRDHVLGSPIDGEVAAERDYSFGKEVARRRIDQNTLSVCVIAVEHTASDETAARQAVEGAETLLNRMFFPILGRR